LWLYAHAALEWLFYATKPSIVSTAPLHMRLLLLCAAPLPLLAILIPAQAVLAGADSFRREAKAYWLAALLPAAVATVLYVVAADNFAKTVVGFGIIDARGVINAILLVGVVGIAAGALRAEALKLAQPRRLVYSAVPAAVVVALSLAAYTVAAADESDGRAADAAKVTAARRPNILLVGMDGVTAERSSAYGYARRKTSPNLEALAARGILYENAFANAGRTYGSLISMISGKLATETHIIFPPVYLKGKDSVDHLPRILRAAGYTTVQIGMRHYTDAYDWNMVGAFDIINGRVEPAEALQPDRSEPRERMARYRRELAERVASRFLHLTFVRRMEDEYRFLTGLGDHSPYFEDEYRLEMAQEFLQSRREPWFLHLHLADSHCCMGAYDKKYQEVDGHLGRLVELLRSTGQAERTLIVAYSDHTRDWKTLERLPLVLVPPGGTAPRRVKTNVQLADVAPTILEYLGIPKAPWMSGQPLQRAESLNPRRPIYSLVEIGRKSVLGPRMSGVRDTGPPFYGATSAAVVVCDRWVKLIFSEKKFESGTIAGHTAPCGDVDERELQTMLTAHLRANGYPVDVQ
jgi:multisubunit Na+/H+ antiporter MnhC subunit